MAWKTMHFWRREKWNNLTIGIEFDEYLGA